HRLRHLVRLTRREAHAALPVAHRHEGVEREAPAALHHLGHAIDRDHVLDEIAPLAAAIAPAGTALAVTRATPALATALTARTAAAAKATAATGGRTAPLATATRATAARSATATTAAAEATAAA